MSIIRTHFLAILVALAFGLAACGGGDDAPSYALSVESAVVSTSYPTEGSAHLSGEGFLPPGSRCGEDPFPGQFDVIRTDHLGPYRLTWMNTTTGKSGEIGLGWTCGSAPTWSTWVPLASGENHIIVSMSSVPSEPFSSGWRGSPGSVEQKVEVVVTRPT